MYMESKLTIDGFGTKWWKLPNGDFHKEDKPAIETVSGNKTWCVNGLRHREDDPAIEWNNGEKYWYLNGVEYTEREYRCKMRSIKLKLLL
jgi:hypothetical protein